MGEDRKKVKYNASVSDRKKKDMKAIVDEIKKSNSIIISFINNLPSNQLQLLRKKLKGKAKIFVAKKRVTTKAFETSGISEIKELGKHISESSAIIFSNEDPFTLASILADSKLPAKAKAGQISKKEIKLDEGPTDFPPGPMTSEFAKVGAKTGIVEGKIAIKEAKVLVKEGEKVSEDVANLLSKLEIKPFEIGLDIQAAYDAKEKKIYLNLIIDKTKTLEELKHIEASILPFAVQIGYICKGTVSFLLGQAESQAEYINQNYANKENNEKSKEE